jgi:hypothetical protein
VSEVDWIENFHGLVEPNLANDLRDAGRAIGASFSIAVRSALVHGNPFQASLDGMSPPTVEIGDLLIVGEFHDEAGFLGERQALLLQMKVGVPGPLAVLGTALVVRCGSLANGLLSPGKAVH